MKRFAVKTAFFTVVFSLFLVIMSQNASAQGLISPVKARGEPEGTEATVSGYAASARCGDGTGFGDEFYLCEDTGGIIAVLNGNENIENGRYYEVKGKISKTDDEIKLIAEKITPNNAIATVKFKRLEIKEAKDYDTNGGRFIRLIGQSSDAQKEDGIITSFIISDGKEQIKVVVEKQVLSLSNGAKGKEALSNELTYKRNVTVNGFVAKVNGETVIRIKDCDDIYVDYHSCTFDKIISEKKASCNEEGIVISECSCGKLQEKIIPKTEHEYKEKLIKASFNEDGKFTNSCNNCGDTLSERIISAVTVCALEEESFVYDGQVKTPKVVLKDKNGNVVTSADINIISSSELGEYSVSVELKGDYKGKTTLYYRIVPKDVSFVKGQISGKNLTLEFTSSEKADGYRIYYKKGEELVTLDTFTATSGTVALPLYCTNYELVIRAFTNTNSGVMWSKGEEFSVYSGPDKVTGITAEEDFCSVTLSWKESSCADGYRIYVYNEKKDKYTILTTTSENSYTAKGLSFDREYSFSVKPYCKKSGKTVWGVGVRKSVSTLKGAVSSFTANEKYTSVELSWRQVKNADFYRVYQYSDKKKRYVVVSDTDSSKFTVEGLKSGTEYSFAVKPCKFDGKNYFGEGVRLTAVTKLTRPTLNVSIKSGKNYISWSKVNGSNGYELYYSYNKDSAYKKVKSLSKTYYTHSAASKSKSCYYKVRAYKKVNGEKIYSSFSAVRKLSR